MPGLDGTGPRGLGPLTGGGRGFCNPFMATQWGMGYPYAGYRPYSRFGMARGWGMGYPYTGYSVYPRYGYPSPWPGLGRGWQTYGMRPYGPAYPPWGAYAPPMAW